MTGTVTDKDGNVVCILDPEKAPFNLSLTKFNGEEKKYLISYTYKRDPVTKQKETDKIAGVMLQ